ncbi:MAG: hypothetical protein U1E77_13400 [Inhella sp.]
MHARNPWPAALRPTGLWLLALLISLAGHALWLVGPHLGASKPAAPVSVASLRIVTVPAPHPALPAAVALQRPAPSPAPRVPRTEPQGAAPTPPEALVPAAEAQSPEWAPQAVLPDPQRYRYRLLQPGQQGLAELIWERDGERYRLLLQRQVEGRELPEWQSEGRVGAGGLEPQRFEVRRHGRLRQALELQPPVQDRLSWLLQLAALAQARDPQRPLPPLGIDLVGWRGGVQRWVFELVGEEPEEAGTADAPAPPLLHLRGQHPADARYRIDVWLDPARGHMPRRWVQRFDEELRTELQLLDFES